MIGSNSQKIQQAPGTTYTFQQQSMLMNTIQSKKFQPATPLSLPQSPNILPGMGSLNSNRQ